VHRFKSILLVHSQKKGSEATLTRAMSLAKRNRAHLTVVDVVEDSHLSLPMPTPVLTPQDLRSRLIKERREDLKRFFAPSRQEGVQLRVKVRVGVPFIEIIREVIRKEHDLVMTTAEGRFGVKRRLFGSLSLHLMRKCPCPVWVVKPERRTRCARILAAVDPDSSNEEKDRLSRTIMDLATSLAALEQSVLHVVHAWSLWQEPVLESHGRSPVVTDEMAHETRTARKRELTELLAAYSSTDLYCHVHLIKGDPADTIARLAERVRVDLIVMGTVSRTGLAGMFIGSTAEDLLQQVNCSVLGLKPVRFESPVR